VRSEDRSERPAAARRDGRVGRLVAVALGTILLASGCALVGTGASLEGQDLRAELEPLLDGGAVVLAGQPGADASGQPGEAVARPEEAEGSGAAMQKADRARTEEPRVKTIKLRPRPRPGPFAMNLYRKGDFVHQQTKDWCVAGSTQTMMNIIDDGKPNRSRRFQERLYREGRRLSPNKAKLGSIGVDLIGWAELLNTRGYGPYVVDGAVSRKGAIKRAAKALRTTGKPVGLVTWRGAHSWVMSGFTATADPAYTNDFRVRAVYIQDVWYPWVSSIWGASRPPDTLVPVGALREDYLPYRRPRARYPKRDGKFMLILPQLPRNTVAR
jgi:hypothetical protein